MPGSPEKPRKHSCGQGNDPAVRSSYAKRITSSFYHEVCRKDIVILGRRVVQCVNPAHESPRASRRWRWVAFPG